MKKVMIFPAIVVLCFTCCLSIKCVQQKNKLMDVEAGMTLQEVHSLLGKPDYRSQGYNNEEWRYKYNQHSDGYDIVSVFFVEDVVEQVDVYFMPGNTVGQGAASISAQNTIR